MAGLLPTKGFELFTNRINTSGSTYIRFSMTAYTSLHAKILVSNANYEKGNEMTLFAGIGASSVLNIYPYVITDSSFKVFYDGMAIFVRLTTTQSNNMFSIYSNMPYSIVSGVDTSGMSTVGLMPV